jgi:hypothetical protein
MRQKTEGESLNISSFNWRSKNAGNTAGGLRPSCAGDTVTHMAKNKSAEPTSCSVRLPVNEISLHECPFYRPGLKMAIGVGGVWELEFEDGHMETAYEEGAVEEDPNKPSKK